MDMNDKNQFSGQGNEPFDLNMITQMANAIYKEGLAEPNEAAALNQVDKPTGFESMGQNPENYKTAASHNQMEKATQHGRTAQQAETHVFRPDMNSSPPTNPTMPTEQDFYFIQPVPSQHLTVPKPAGGYPYQGANGVDDSYSQTAETYQPREGQGVPETGYQKANVPQSNLRFNIPMDDPFMMKDMSLSQPPAVEPTGNDFYFENSIIKNLDGYYFQKEQEPHQNFKEDWSKYRMFNAEYIKKDFPVLQRKVNGKPLVWLDNGATTQKPQCVIDAVRDFYENYNSNIHRGAHTLAAEATDAYEDAREKVKNLIGAESKDQIIYVRGTTEGINLLANTFGKQRVGPGDEILVSELEHHANIVPWQMLAKEVGAKLRMIPINDRGDIMMEAYEQLFNQNTKLVAIGQVSNALGTVVPVHEMIKTAHRHGVPVVVDGAQSVQHMTVNVQEMDADFFVFSGHKIFAPTGIGIVYGKMEHLEMMPPWQGGGNMIDQVSFEETTYNGVPAKFEAGTPSIGDAIGLGAAIDYVQKNGMENIHRYESELMKYMVHSLSPIKTIEIIANPTERAGALSFIHKSIPTITVGQLLDKDGIAVRAGHHCAQPALRHFGQNSSVRPSLAFYNTYSDIDRLREAILKLGS